MQPLIVCSLLLPNSRGLNLTFYSFYKCTPLFKTVPPSALNVEVSKCMPALYTSFGFGRWSALFHEAKSCCDYFADLRSRVYIIKTNSGTKGIYVYILAVSSSSTITKTKLSTVLPQTVFLYLI